MDPHDGTERGSPEGTDPYQALPPACSIIMALPITMGPLPIISGLCWPPTLSCPVAVTQHTLCCVRGKAAE